MRRIPTLLALALALPMLGPVEGARGQSSEATEPAETQRSRTQEKATRTRSEAAVDPTAMARIDNVAALSASARRLAGLSPSIRAKASPHAAIWAEHAEAMDSLWLRIDERFLGAVRAFQVEHLSSLEGDSRPLVYPFGGPDLLHAEAFFPGASTYVLGGLEPPGRIVDPETLAAEDLVAELARLRAGFRNLLERGYFVTTQMERDFTVGELDGFLPVITIFLARAGWLPRSVGYIGLDEDGTPRQLEQATPGVGGALRILAVDREGREREILYFSRDVSDQGLAERPEFVRYLESLGDFDVYMKSAEYLLHMPAFGTLRDLLLERSKVVLQDDSGLRVKDLEGWQLELFGAYTDTLPTYRKWFQEHLAGLFRTTKNVPPLGFGIGYHATTEGGCLILARRPDTE